MFIKNYSNVSIFLIDTQYIIFFFFFLSNEIHTNSNVVYKKNCITWHKYATNATFYYVLLISLFF